MALQIKEIKLILYKLFQSVEKQNKTRISYNQEILLGIWPTCVH